MTSLTVPTLNFNTARPPVSEIAQGSALSTNLNIQMANLDQSKMILVLHSKDVTPEEELLFRKFGKTRHWNSGMINVDLQQLECDYLFCDMTDKMCRLHVGKLDFDQFRVCAYCHVWEKFDETYRHLGDVNVVTKFPFIKVAFKDEFDNMLLDKKRIKSPNSCLSLLSFLINGLRSIATA